MQNTTNKIIELDKLNYSNYVPGLDEYVTDEELSTVELYPGYPIPLLKFASVCCILFMVIGISGNLITVIALARYKKVQNATAVFIINLSVADLLFCCIVLPTMSVTYWTKAWTHGKLYCYLFPLAKYVLVSVSMLTVIAICINRYILICHPNLYITFYTRTNILIMLALIWMYGIVLFSLPFFEVWGRFTLDPHVGSCTIVPDENQNDPKKIIVSFLFTFTCITMVICYARILWVVRKTSIKRNRRAARYEMQSMSNTSHISTHIESVFTTPESSTTSEGKLNTDNEIDNCYAEIDLSSNTDNEHGQMRLRLHVEPRRSNKKGMPRKKDKRLRKMVTVIMLMFCICYVPITLVKLMYKSFNSHPLTNILGYLMIYLTPCINPIIYVLISREYRRAYKSLFRIWRW